VIRYAKSIQEIEQLISATAPSWLKEANRRTVKFRKAKAYKEKSPIWSQVKPVYMALQKGKCAYCERSLEPGPEGNIEWDGEHFRPKSQVREWLGES